MLSKNALGKRAQIESLARQSDSELPLEPAGQPVSICTNQI